MATTNGTSTPPAALPPTHTTTDAAPSAIPAHKRKHEDESSTTSARKRQTQRDILELLQQHDTTPSFLDHDLSHAVSGGERSPKKARLSDAGKQTTIALNLSAGTYDGLSALKLDASRVAQDVESKLRAKSEDGESKEGVRLPIEDLKQIQRAKALEQLIGDVVDKELQHGAMAQTAGIKKETSMVNGHVSPAPAAGGRAGTVLTLFGNAPTPKQLFSSMQHSSHHDQMVKSELPVEEMSLPNGLTATRIAPAPADDSRKGPTFEDSFAPPYSLAALNPPKVTKRSSTRDNTTIYWEFKDLHRASRKGGYTVQSMTTGDWLGYGGVVTADSETSRQKRKQRDRALSSGAESSKEVPNLLSPEEQQAREEEALFRRAYSSFAPSHDNSRSVVPAETRSMLWWHKVGAQRYRDTFAVDPALLDADEAAETTNGVAATEPEEADFGKVIEELEELDVDMDDVQQVSSKTDVEQVLSEISELLNTLASHQRIRNATLAPSISSSRTPISPAPVLASRIGKPDEPAEDELAVYNALRRELAYLVLKLPPYAVAKLDGDQLAELGVSTVIPIKTKNVRGTMEEDQVARLAKHNAAATAAGIATLTRSNSSTSGQHYNTTAQRTPAIGSAANTRYGQSAQYTGSRTPATTTQYQRTASSQAQYGTATAAGSAATRPTYGTQPNQYTRPGAPQQSYSQTNGTGQQQYYQQPRPQQTSSSQYYGTQYSSATPGTQPQTRPTYNPASQQQTQYAPRPLSAASGNTALAAFQNNNKPISNQPVRTSSPANVQPRPVYPAQYPQQQQQQGQGPTSGRATPTYGSGPQTPVNGFARPPPPQQGQQQGLVARAQSGTPGPNGVV